MSTVTSKHLRECALELSESLKSARQSGVDCSNNAIVDLLAHVALFLADNVAPKIDVHVMGGGGAGDTAEWLICSREHRGWWKPGHAGYTWDVWQAGLYSLTEARTILEKANVVAAHLGINMPVLPEESIVHARAMGRTP